jgi:hypothetical protein
LIEALIPVFSAWAAGDLCHGKSLVCVFIAKTDEDRLVGEPARAAAESLALSHHNKHCTNDPIHEACNQTLTVSQEKLNEAVAMMNKNLQVWSEFGGCQRAF